MNRRMIYSITMILLYFANSIAAEKMSVIILDQQNRDAGYRYVVPGYAITTSNAAGNIKGARNSASDAEADSSHKTNALGATESYLVTGATLTLKLSDNRIVVVNCSPKINWAPIPGSRSCLIPPINKIKVEFSGDNATLTWPVSIDGKKIKKETYKILAVFDESEKSEK
jgi:hypothetical protein